MGMFWILCARTGARKLVDLEASTIIRVALSQTQVQRDRKRHPPDYFTTRPGLLADDALPMPRGLLAPALAKAPDGACSKPDGASMRLLGDEPGVRSSSLATRQASHTTVA